MCWGRGRGQWQDPQWSRDMKEERGEPCRGLGEEGSRQRDQKVQEP